MFPIPFTDVAQTLMRAAQANLQRDSELVPLVFAIIDGQLRPYICIFHSQQEKQEMYAQLWDSILPTNPECIFMVNDARMKSVANGDPINPRLKALEQAGDTSIEHAIIIGIFPRGESARLLISKYRRVGKRFAFDAPRLSDDNSLSGALGPSPWLRQGNLKVDRVLRHSS